MRKTKSRERESLTVVVLFFGLLTCLALVLTSCNTNTRNNPFNEDINALEDLNEYILFDLEEGRIPEQTANLYVFSNLILIKKMENIASVTYKQHQ
tara:strand:+ start:334 stop:621 length:288 start_codon:yes stop_codon:yes gene_type:complete